MIPSLSKSKVCVIGDMIYDRFTYGSVDRVSPEAPVPVVKVKDFKDYLGGAANVMANLVAADCDASLVSCVGHDEAGSNIKQMVSTLGRYVDLLQTPKTIVKERIIGNGQQIARVDEEIKYEVDLETIKKHADRYVRNADVVVVSDYGKGFVSAELVKWLVKTAKYVIADPKGKDINKYRGVDLLTPNMQEWEDLVGGGLVKTSMERAAHAMIDNVVLKMGPSGMMWHQGGGFKWHEKAHAKNPIDVSGAGDTVVAWLAMGIACGMDIPAAMSLASDAAAVSVMKEGTSVVYPIELPLPSKFVSWDVAMDVCNSWRSNSFSIGLVNGCFDMLHPGHLELLKRASNFCDRLVVAINSDQSVRELKGPDRPVIRQNQRAETIARIKEVDLVILFDELDAKKVVADLLPDKIIKGKEYYGMPVDGEDVVGVENVLFIDMEPYSTTGTLAKWQSTITTKK